MGIELIAGRMGSLAPAAALLSIVVAGGAGFAEAGQYLGPCAVVASGDGKMLYVANADAGQIAFVDLPRRAVLRSISTPAPPTGLAIGPDGAKLYVTCAAPQSHVLVLDTISGKVTATIAVGHTAVGPAITPDGKRLYVCNRFDNDVSVVDLEANREVARLPAVREPVAAGVSPDAKLVLVANHLPADRADVLGVAATVTIIDTRTRHTSVIRLSNGASGVRGLCVSPDGNYAYVTHILARYELPTVQVDYGWINANAISVIDIAKKRLLNTVLLDDMKLGAANPWGVACTADAKWLCVTHAGTDELSVIDAPGLIAKLMAIPEKPDSSSVGEVVYDDRNELLDYFRRLRASRAGKAEESIYEKWDLYTLGNAAGVSNDLAFLAGLRQRIKLHGKGPRGLAVVGSKAYVAEYFSDTLGVVDIKAKRSGPAGSIALGPRPRLSLRRRGEMLFNDADLCFQHWQSCASCHPDGRADGLNWDLVNDGMGNLKNTKSLLLAHKTPPAMSTGVRPSGKAAVRGGIAHILFSTPREQDAVAIDRYLESVGPVACPQLVGGRLSPAAQRGKRLFLSTRVGCSICHPPPLYTDLQLHDVGSKSPIDFRKDYDTPTLIEVWRTAPYLHDGRYTTIKELIAKGKHGKERGELDALGEQQINDLVEFVLSL